MAHVHTASGYRQPEPPAWQQRTTRWLYLAVGMTALLAIGTGLSHPLAGHAIGTDLAHALSGQGSAPGQPGEPANAPPAQMGGQGDWWDPSTWVPDALNAAFTWMFQGIVTGMSALIQAIFSLNVINTTDPNSTYSNPAVIHLWATFAGVANALLICVVVWVGYSIMVGPGLGISYLTARELLPRIVLGALAINCSGFFARTVIDFNDALCSVPAHNLTAISALWQTSDVSFGKAVFILAFGICTILLIVQEFVRLALIDVLIITAPLGLLCWIAPETQGWARLWTSTFISAVIVQFLQLLVLALGGVLMQAGGNGLGGFLALIIGIATLYTAFKVPGMLRSVGGGQAPSVLSDVTGIAGDVLIAARLAVLAA